LNRFITSLYIVLFVGFGLAACFLFIDARSEYNRLKQTQARSRQLLAEKEAQLREQERFLERLQTDPAFVERVMRSRHGWVKPEETIYDFGNPGPTP